MRASGAILMSVCAMWAGGCVDSGRPRIFDRAHHVELLAHPAPLDWDGQAGPDGWQVQVSLYRRDRPKGAIAVSGTLELLLLEGDVPRDALDQAVVLQTWSYSAEDLSRCLGRSLAGWRYALRLAWDKPPRRGRAVTLVARYRPPDSGGWIYSAPLSSLSTGE